MVLPEKNELPLHVKSVNIMHYKELAPYRITRTNKLKQYGKTQSTIQEVLQTLARVSLCGRGGRAGNLAKAAGPTGYHPG
jgi:hypothetical protein